MEIDKKKIREELFLIKSERGDQSLIGDIFTSLFKLAGSTEGYTKDFNEQIEINKIIGSTAHLSIELSDFFCRKAEDYRVSDLSDDNVFNEYCNALDRILVLAFNTESKDTSYEFELDYDDYDDYDIGDKLLPDYYLGKIEHNYRSYYDFNRDRIINIKLINAKYNKDAGKIKYSFDVDFIDSYEEMLNEAV